MPVRRDPRPLVKRAMPGCRAALSGHEAKKAVDFCPGPGRGDHKREAWMTQAQGVDLSLGQAGPFSCLAHKRSCS